MHRLVERRWSSATCWLTRRAASLGGGFFAWAAVACLRGGSHHLLRLATSHALASRRKRKSPHFARFASLARAELSTSRCALIGSC